MEIQKRKKLHHKRSKFLQSHEKPPFSQHQEKSKEKLLQETRKSKPPPSKF